MRTDKYKWMRVDTIYDQTMNSTLYYMDHISNGDIFGTQYKMVTKRISEIDTVIP